jgi:hypothetical protein
MRAVADANLAIVISNLIVTLIDQGKDGEAVSLAREVLALVDGAALRGFSCWPLLVAFCALCGDDDDAFMGTPAADGLRADALMGTPAADGLRADAFDDAALAALVDRVEAGVGDLAELEFADVADKAAARARAAGRTVLADRLAALARTQHRRLGTSAARSLVRDPAL